MRAALDEGCRVRVPLARRLRWGLGERLVAKGYFRGLRRAQDIRLELRAGG